MNFLNDNNVDDDNSTILSLFVNWLSWKGKIKSGNGNSIQIQI